MRTWHAVRTSVACSAHRIAHALHSVRLDNEGLAHLKELASDPTSPVAPYRHAVMALVTVAVKNDLL